MHWAAQFIGVNWTPQFQCWDLVREARKVGFGDFLPPIAIGATDNTETIRGLMNEWRAVEGEPQEGDIVLMDGPSGRHVGLVISDGRRTYLLHNPGYIDKHDRPHGSVVAQFFADAMRGGYRHFEIWRKG